MSRSKRSLPIILRACALVAALLCYNLAALSHDHEQTRTGEQVLCALCVYGTSGSIDSPQADIGLSFAHITLTRHSLLSPLTPVRDTAKIRGPPSLA